MKKITLFLFILFTFALSFSDCLANEESIESYSVYIDINDDSSVEVLESIQYNFGSGIKKGIFRTIPLTFKEKKSEEEYTTYTLKITEIEAYDDAGNDQLFDITKNRKELRIDLGSDVNEFTGLYTFHLKYKVEGVFRYEDDFDSLNWNVIGTDWSVPIYGAQVTLNLPEPVFLESIESDCYVGLLGSMDSCSDMEVKYVSDGTETVNKKIKEIAYTHKQSLGNGRGMTVDFGLPKGVVNRTEREEVPPLPSFFILLLIGTGFVPLFYILKLFKDSSEKNSKKSIVTQYDVPSGVSPSDVGLVRDRVFGNNEFVAELLSLAIKHYIRIVYLEKIYFSVFNFPIFKKKRFLFLKIKSDDGLSESENKVMKLIFNKRLKMNKSDTYNLIKSFSIKKEQEIINTVDSAIDVSSLKKIKRHSRWFHSTFKDLIKIAEKEVVSKGFYRRNFKESFSSAFKEMGLYFLLMIVLIAVITLTAVFLYPVSSLDTLWGTLYLIVFISFGGVMFTVSTIKKRLPLRTDSGIRLKNHIAGLRRYIKVAEKERMEYHFDPKKNPELFERLLPFAVVLGLQSKWIKHLSDLNYDPDWYISSTPGSLNANGLNSMVSSLSSTSSSSSSGSGGGAGGGAGGGGGGSR